MLKESKKSGFTLVELLVVISIIAILSVIGIAIYTDAQKLSRDGKRKGDMDAIVKALAQYKAAKGVYPCFASCGWAIVSGLTGLSPDYITKIPDDPLGYKCTAENQGPGYLYSVSADASSFTLFINLENTKDATALATKPTPKVPPGSDPGSCTSECANFTIASGLCSGQVYNYWVNNQL